MVGSCACCSPLPSWVPPAAHRQKPPAEMLPPTRGAVVGTQPQVGVCSAGDHSEHPAPGGSALWGGGAQGCPLNKTAASRAGLEGPVAGTPGKATVGPSLQSPSQGSPVFTFLSKISCLTGVPAQQAPGQRTGLARMAGLLTLGHTSQLLGS